MNTNTIHSIVAALTLLLLTFGFVNTAAAQNKDDAAVSSNAAYLENMQRMQRYDTAIAENLRGASSNPGKAPAMGEENEYSTAPQVTTDGHASTDVVVALEVLIDASNLSTEQRARLARRLQEVNN